MTTPGERWRRAHAAAILAAALCVGVSAQTPESSPVLHPQTFQHYFDGFARDEQQMLGSAPALPWDWFVRNIPWLDTPDAQINQTYYFRWYAFQKHLEATPDGYVVTEFVDKVPWAGKFDTIDAAAGHHIREARWLRNPEYADDYMKFWLGPDGEPRRYSFWAADSVYQLYLATGDRDFATSLLPALEKNYEAWQKTHEDANGLFWQIDDRDGMEDTISGNGYRPTINSYMYGDAIAISNIASMGGDPADAARYKHEADRLRAKIDSRLWNPQDQFYETVARQAPSGWSGVRELIGYIPWYFDLPSTEHDVAWKFLFAPDGFAGNYGPTTAERRSPRFRYKEHHECLWNGPSWPYATTQTLVALANLLNGPSQNTMTNADYFHLLSVYTNSQQIRLPDGRMAPWIDEDLDADTGDWIARNLLTARHELPKNRGRYYNHSGYADLIITGLIGLRPHPGNEVDVHPLLPADAWEYFALEGLPYHGHLLTILYDKTGKRYDRGKGFQVLCDGQIIAHTDKLEDLHASLPFSKH